MMARFVSDFRTDGWMGGQVGRSVGRTGDILDTSRIYPWDWERDREDRWAGGREREYVFLEYVH